MATSPLPPGPSSAQHGALMDAIYRRQKHIYDLTRKYYLFGRDPLINGLKCAPGARVLEIGCGTGRNLAQIGRRWPGVELHGLDISHEMLATARERLGTDAKLSLGDATGFEPVSLFGCGEFDRVVISFALSMIPEWRKAVSHAAGLLAPGGSLHIVDFSDFSGIPGPLRALMRGWLARFHVSPRLELADRAASEALRRRLTLRTRRGPLGYYRLITLRDRRPAAN
jgi:S-adenosylmethionine-diacylgycerolhomoserine-N-methlytransferase